MRKPECAECGMPILQQGRRRYCGPTCAADRRCRYLREMRGRTKGERGVTDQLLDRLAAQPSRTRKEFGLLGEEKAACKGAPQTHFFPEHSGPYTDGRKLCAKCPIRDACGALAIEHFERHGLWGGLTPNERDGARRRLIQRQKVSAA